MKHKAIDQHRAFNHEYLIPGGLDEELEELAVYWHDYLFEKRLALMNYLIQSVSLDMMSPKWVRIRVHWTLDE